MMATSAHARLFGVALFALGFLSAGCGPSALPEPVLRAITPSQINEGEAPVVTLDADVVLPFRFDYGRRTASVESGVTVRLGDAALQNAAVGADGRITGVAPFGLAAGAYDVRLELPDGRSAVLPSAFTVKPGAFPDAFNLDAVSNQTRSEPFDITIRAVGASAASFNGVVTLTVSKGTIEPGVSGPFTGGVRVERVTLDSPGMDVTITVTDAQGHTGTSNAFRVVP